MAATDCDQRMGQATPTARTVEVWPIDRLRPYERNSRTHSRQQIRQIARSIQQFGFTNPILVDADDGILAGHGRLAAARDMGLQHVPVIVLDHLTPEQRRAYVIADNQLALTAGWDAEVLQQEVMQLNLEDFDLDVLGFSPDEITKILDGEWRPDQQSQEPADDDDHADDDEPFQRGQPLAIILEPQEMHVWRQAKEQLGLARDKAALLRLATQFLSDEQQ